jgi:transposase
MRPPLHSSLVRLGVRPDEPAALVGPRPRGSRRPHTDARVAAVRRLIEQSTLTYSEIAARTGVGRASICRWTRDGGWRRPPFAPRATDTVPSARASARLKQRTLAARLQTLAERYLRELEDSAGIDLDKLAQALELAKMAKLAAMGRRRRRNTPGGSGLKPNEPARPIMQLCVADVDLHRAPRSAVEDFLANREPPREEPGPRRRGRRSKHDEHHAWLLERER